MSHKKVDLSYLFFVTYQATTDEFCAFIDALPEEQSDVLYNFYKIKKNVHTTTFVLDNQNDNRSAQNSTFFSQSTPSNNLNILGHLIHNSQWEKIDFLLNKFEHLANEPVNQNENSALGILLNAKHSYKSIISAILLKHGATFSDTDPDPILRTCNQSPECSHLLPKFFFSKKSEHLSLNDYIGKKKQWHPFYNGIKDLNTLKILFDFLVPQKISIKLEKPDGSTNSGHFIDIKTSGNTFNDKSFVELKNNANALHCAFEAICAGCRTHQNTLTNEHLEHITDWVFFASKKMSFEQKSNWVCILLDYHKKQENPENEQPQNNWIFQLLQSFEPTVLAHACATNIINSIQNHYDSNTNQKQLKLLCESGMNVNDNIQVGNFHTPVPLFFYNAMLLDTTGLQIFKDYGCTFSFPINSPQTADIISIIANLNPDPSLGYPVDVQEKTISWLKNNTVPRALSMESEPQKLKKTPFF